MRCFALFTILVFGLVLPAHCQVNTLFDDSKVSSIHITIPPDSLNVILTDVLSDHYFMARFVFDDNEGNDTVENVGFRLRGNTSRYAKKKSFKISFNEYVSGRRYQGVKKVNLNGEHNDPTMVREKFFYELWGRAGMVERRTSFVKLYINEVYYGLYTNLEEMDKDWLTRNYTDNDGNLYKCTYPADLVYLGGSQETYKNLENYTVTGGRVYDLQTNQTADDYTRLVALVTALEQPVNASFEASINSVLNVDYYLKALALDVATGNWDNYSYNKNNFYLYDDPSTGKFFFITYDPDNTFGIDWFGVDWAKRNCLQWINPDLVLPLAEKILATPSFFNRYKLYLDTMARNVINPDSVFSRIDAIKLLITPAAVADTFRTLDYGYSIADFNYGFTQMVDGHSPYGIKPFLATRKNYILNQLLAAGISDTPLSDLIIQANPNPADEHTTLSANQRLNQTFHCQLADMRGHVVREFEWETPYSTCTIDLSSVLPGVYILKLRSDIVDKTLRILRK